MQFVYPAFLFALFALIIPVIIHLFNFRRYHKVYFSNVQFLKEVQEQQASGRNLKERLILASRLLALTFLVFAFARPYIPGALTTKPGQQQIVSIFVDNSYSMQALSREGTLLDEARARAKEIAQTYNINTRFQILTQDFDGKHQRLLSRDEFNDAVDAIKISAQSRGMQAIINRQQSLLQTQGNAKSSAFVVSDFQKNMGSGKLTLDTALNVNFIQLKANPLPNIAADSVWLLSAVHRPGESEKLVIRLHNYADEKAVNVPLKLLINGAQKALGSYTINPNSTQIDTLSFSGLQAGWQRAELQLQDNPVTFDNQFYFSFYVQAQMPILLISGDKPDIYLNAAFGSDTFFKVTQTTDGHVDYSSLQQYPLIAISNVKTVSGGLAQQLKVYVQKGGTLAFFPAADADLGSYQSLLQPLNAAYPEKLVKEATKVSAINLKAQVYRNTFENMPQNPDLPQVKSYYQLNNNLSAGGEKLLMLSGNQPFWEQFKYRQGKVYVSTVPLDETFSNLPKHALFVTTMLRIALLSGHDQPLYYTLGNSESIETAPVQIGPNEILTLVQGDQKIIPDVRRQEGSTLLYLSDQLHKPGHYQLIKQDSTVQWLAFNNNRSESDLHYLTRARLQNMLPKKSIVLAPGDASIKTMLSESNFGLQLWKLCILLALIFLAAEIVLIRFYKPGKTVVS
ncbi:BatA domain-containing protein [Mucilaginibacter polytrichastri]|uniref:Aerotolerance regulator N-terminal domain-containing protein n=1 Tax=Mucilaginibacter polytrichastri TaxID=1302689 RepID=A0A1Q5ZVL9_9SPHI|nr:BatA domain-containing protein [Mucilaginibacter polytrichastri]OKS85800.1 hypothetical protein RG47T_1246 [Mucilaginibacter polytrichastri]SFS61412.1 N-terminal double-transmembrane domain-containing protein [Mucilaginibacter polytrichastri]